MVGGASQFILPSDHVTLSRKKLLKKKILRIMSWSIGKVLHLLIRIINLDEDKTERCESLKNVFPACGKKS